MPTNYLLPDVERWPIGAGSPVIELIDVALAFGDHVVGECDPTPPFTAVSRTTIDALLLEVETACAPRERGCEPPVCKQPPPACEAHAECQRGRPR